MAITELRYGGKQSYNKDFQLCNNCYSGLYKYIENYMEGCRNE